MDVSPLTSQPANQRVYPSIDRLGLDVIFFAGGSRPITHVRTYLRAKKHEAILPCIYPSLSLYLSWCESERQKSGGQHWQSTATQRPPIVSKTRDTPSRVREGIRPRSTRVHRSSVLAGSGHFNAAVFLPEAVTHSSKGSEKRPDRILGPIQE